ncbi:MAG TPA: signal peptidase I [Candidatus Thermoplasmatota archaeon]|nr:signal peptidase I [Candidatus Thermoplasmatota archaeon]
MRSIQEIESIIDSLPSPRVTPKITQTKRKKSFWKTLTVIGISLCTILVAMMVLTGMLQVLIVLSGSMQPTFNAGDVILTVDTPVRSLKVNDIITYWSPDNMKSLVTHRIVTISKDSQGLSFQTKGDANEGVDQYVVPAELVVGRMVLTIPYVGHVASISHSFLGFLLLVLAPGIVVISAEVLSIVKKEKTT